MNMCDELTDNLIDEDIIIDDIQFEVDEIQAIIDDEANVINQEIDWEDSITLD